MEKLKHGAFALCAMFTQQALAAGTDLKMSAKEKDGTFKLVPQYGRNSYEASRVGSGCDNWYNSCNSGEKWSVPSFTDASFETDPAHAWFCSDVNRQYG